MEHPLYLRIAFISLFLAVAAVALNIPSLQKQVWTYIPLSVKANSSDESLLKIDMKIERKSRTEFTIGGTIFANMDIKDDTMVEVTTFYSSTGSMDWKQLPYGTARQHVFSALEKYYKGYVMESVANCSDLPQYTGPITSIEKKTYTGKGCVITSDNFPQHFQEGYYRVVLHGYGEVEFYAELISQIYTPK